MADCVYAIFFAVVIFGYVGGVIYLEMTVGQKDKW